MKRYHRRLVAGFAATLAVSLGVVGAASSASGATSVTRTAIESPDDVRLAAIPTCSRGSVCLFPDTHFRGTPKAVSACGTIGLPAGYGNFGSFINNQWGNAPTTFLNASGQVLLETQGDNPASNHTSNTIGTLVDDIGVGTRGHIAKWRVC
jgi:hypothetical protein